jgi:hypothetical protein
MVNLTNGAGMPHVFTSLHYATEKLLEAEYFLGRSMEVSGPYFQYELNAFLSASRNVTFVMQSSMSKARGFTDWYLKRQAEMRADAAMRFFLELRNVSQKQGPVSYVSGSAMDGGYTYRFVEDRLPIPPEVVGIDIRVSCALHLVKLGILLLDFVKNMPFLACPWRAFSEEGMIALGFDWSDAEAAAGFAAGWTNVDPPAEAEVRFKYLRKEIEPLDVCAIERIASNDLRGDNGPLDFSHLGRDKLIDRLAIHLADPDLGNNPRAAFLKAIGERIKETENGR